MKNKTLKLVCGFALLGAMVTVNAQSIIPSGVQQNVAISTVTGAWGWTIAYEDTYANPSVSIATMFANVPTGDYVMLAAAPVGSSTFTLLAAALQSDVQTYTPINTPHAANGAEWYYNGYSIGFAGLGDSINQFEADTASADAANRLSWHAGIGAAKFSQFDPSQVPQYVYGGWRAGAAMGLNDDSTWNRFVLYGSLTPTPEPSTMAMSVMGGLGGLLMFRRRK